MNALTEKMGSSKRQNWITPPELVGLLHKLGPIAFDPATMPSNPMQAPIFCTRRGVFTIRDVRLDTADGLRANWAHWHEQGALRLPPEALIRYGIHPARLSLTYVNCEYRGLAARDDKRSWRLAILRNGLSPVLGGMVVLVPSRVETQWFREIFVASSMRLDWGSPTLGSRLRFVVGKKKRDSALFPCSVFYFGTRRDEFASVFESHGTLLDPRHARVSTSRARMQQQSATPPCVAMRRTGSAAALGRAR